MCNKDCARLRQQNIELKELLRQANDLNDELLAMVRRLQSGRTTAAATVPDGVIWWRGKGGDDGR